MTDIPTRTLALQPWVRTPGVECCFPDRAGGAILLKARGQIVLDERLRPIPLATRPTWTTHAARLPDGGVALATSSARRREPNLHLFTPDGRRRASLPIGDGIEHLAIDQRGRIWVGYFDEGIFGGDPLSAHGLSRFGPDGRLEWQWSSPPLPVISDCDALTLDAADSAWVCPYTDYAITRIADNDARVVAQSPVYIPSGLIVGPTHFGLLGGTDYHGNTGGGTMFTINADRSVTTREIPDPGPPPTDKDSVVTLLERATGTRTQVQLIDETATPLPLRRAKCNATTACILTDTAVYRVTLAELLTA